MDTLHRGQTPADDLFERDDTHHGGTYSPLETLVRQTSLKGGWRVKGAQNIRRAQQHSPSPVGSTHGRSLLGGPGSSSNHSYIPRPKGEQVFSQQQFAPEQSTPQRQGLPFPSSPLLRAEFRSSTAPSYNGEGDSTADMSLDALYRTRDSGNPFRLTSRLATMEDDTIDRVRAEYQWDSASDIDSPLESSTRGVLPPSFRFEDNDAASPTSGGRPLSDRSLVLPPSVKALSLKNKSAGPSTPNSPARMSLYSESSYSSGSKPPWRNYQSFLPSRSTTNSPGPPPSAVPRTSVSDASEPSIYGDPEPPSLPRPSVEVGEAVDFADALEHSRDTNWNASNPARNDEDIDLADVLERSAMGQWRRTRKSDLEPFAFRQYEGRGKSGPSVQLDTEARRAGQRRLQDNDFPASPAGVTPSTAPNIVVTSEPSSSSHHRSSSTQSKSDPSSSPISSTAPSPIISSYPYLPDAPQTNKPLLDTGNGPSTVQLPTSQSAPAALSSPLHSPAIAAIELPLQTTPQIISSENRAPSLVSANLGGRFNFSRPLRSHNVLPTSPSAPVPGTIASNYMDSGWSPTADALGVSSSSQLATREESVGERSYTWRPGDSGRRPFDPPQFQKQEQSKVLSKGVDSSLNLRPQTSNTGPSLGSHFAAPGLRNDADSYRDSGSSGGSGNSESLYALEQRFPAPPGSRVNSSTNLNVVVSADTAVTVPGGTGTILGPGRSLDDSNMPGVSFVTPSGSRSIFSFLPVYVQNLASRGITPGGRLSPIPNTRNQDLFASPRAAPRPPSPNTQTQQSPYLNVPSNSGMYSSPMAARSQPQLSSPRNDDLFTEKVYSSTNASTRPGLSPTAGAQPSPQPNMQGQKLLGMALHPPTPSVVAATGRQTRATSPTPRLRPVNTTHLAPGATSPAPNATIAPADGTGSRISLYSNYSFYGIPESPRDSPGPTTTQFPDSPQGAGSSPNNSPNESRRPSAQGDGSRSPAPHGLWQMNPYQGSQGRLTPSRQPAMTSLAASQLTPDGLYQPQYLAEQHYQRSFFKRKKTPSRSTTATPQSYNPSTSSVFSHSQGLPQASTPEEYLQMGITYHERDQLALSAHCFEQSATYNGGCGFGMLMWGLALRHGWGVKRDERIGFAWVRQAADAAVGDLEAAVNGVEANAVKVSVMLYP
jgi:hypothetical protein